MSETFNGGKEVINVLGERGVETCEAVVREIMDDVEGRGAGRLDDLRFMEFEALVL